MKIKLSTLYILLALLIVLLRAAEVISCSWWIATILLWLPFALAIVVPVVIWLLVFLTCAVMVINIKIKDSYNNEL